MLFIEDEYQCDFVETANHMIDKVCSKYNLIILDSSLESNSDQLEQLSLLDITKIIRTDYNIPIIILSNTNKDLDKIAALQVGADDYFTKPLNYMEVFLKSKNIIKRVVTITENPLKLYKFSNWLLNCNKMILENINSGEIVNLTTHLYKILICFIENRGMILTRELLMEKINPDKYDIYDRSIDVQIGRLRKILEFDIRNPQIIKTKRGAGYMFDSNIQKI
ncbi:response regulator transcription factor [Francisella hispaniensis]|nr:response regulator transcription factor [Francisella hispaniensis]